MGYKGLDGTSKFESNIAGAGDDDALPQRGKLSMTASVGYHDCSRHAGRWGKRCNQKPKTLQVRRSGGRF